MAQIPQIVIDSLRGGMNDTDPPHILPNDQCVLMENVEVWETTLGERRLGCSAVAINGCGAATEEGIVHMNTHMPPIEEASPLDTELFAIGATPGTSVTISRRTAAGVWADFAPTSPADNLETGQPTVFRIQTESVHGKFFIAAKSDADRLHLFDSLSGIIRRAGLAQPAAAPTAADSGGAGTLSGVRIYRIRYVQLTVDGMRLRSEPSEELIFTPSGTNASVTITRPALINEVETHWELEASNGDGNFYVIDTISVASTTTTDTFLDPSEYGDAENGFELSADIGDYTVIESVKFVKKDLDRLVFGGSWENFEHGSRISWTPRSTETGVGNDERIPIDTDNFIDLDWMDGGELTGLSDPVNGSFYAFKWSRIYKIQRTGQIDGAYEGFPMSTQRGALPGSIISGTDEYGRGAVYFLDPSVGPLRLGTQGLQYCQGLQATWKKINTGATAIISHGVYYPDKQQVHWWVSINGEDKPNYRIVLQVNRIESDNEGTNKGWSVHTGRSSFAWSSCIVPETVLDESSGSVSLTFRPYIGMDSPEFIQRMDSGNTDNGEPYVAKIVTRPYFITGLLNRWGAMTASLLAVPNDDPTTQINVKFIRDFGKEESGVITDFVPDVGESLVIKPFDNLKMSSSIAIQVEFSDYEAPDFK